VKRKFSVPFGHSITATGKADRIEVIVRSLTTSSSGSGNVTYPAVFERRMITLTDDINTAEFMLTPSYEPGLDRPILYRVSWRKDFLGRVENTDFTMPNSDISYDDLFDLGAIMGDETYLKEQDLGVAGRVARLNSAGLVIDANGNEVTGGDATAALDNRITQEILDRMTIDAANRSYAAAQLEIQISSVISSSTAMINGAITEFRAADLTERIARESAIAALQITVNGIVTDTNASVASLSSSLALLNATMATKADLVGGKIPTSQIPSIALGTALSVNDEAGMLALTTTQVQPGDIAIRPDGTWMLVSASPALLASWKRLSAAAGSVTSVNGQTGLITLGATDVGARPVGLAIAESEITGLTADLAAKLSQTDLATINTALGTKASAASLSTLQNSAVLKTAGGFVPTTLLDSDVPLVNNLNQLVKKDGTVISTGGGSGAVASVNGHIGTVVLNAADVGARDSTVAVPLADVAGLQDALDAKAAQTGLTSALSRISQNETDIAALGGGGSAPKNLVSWVDNGLDDIGTVAIRSPFGRTPGGVLYYNHLGADPAEAMWPYVAANGALSFRKLDLNAPAEAAFATVSALDALTAVVAGKATTAALNALQTTVDGKVAQAAFDTLVTTVGTKATTAALNALSTTVATKADQTALDNTNTALQSKVDTSTFNTQSDSVDQQLATKYQVPVGGIPATTLDAGTQSKLNRGDAAKTSVDAATATGTASQLVKTDSAGLFAVVAATAAGHPYRKDQVDTALSSKADSSALTTGLAGKADLVGGKVPTGQIPAIATHETYAVANRAAMLALTTAQVQLGDVAIITSTADQGTYALVAADPSQFGNWLAYQSLPNAVTSVNGYTGTIVLNAADVGARSAAVAIPQSDITGLTTALTNKADTTYVNAQVATRTTPSNVTDQVATLGQAKFAVDYAANAAVSSLSGQQSIDGTLVALDKRVLLPLQSASSQNGIWIVKAGAWIRPTDMASGSALMPGALIAIQSGGTNADSIWQMTGTGTVTVDTTAQNWAKILRGGLPIAYTASTSPYASIVVDSAAKTLAVKVAAPLLIGASGLTLDTTAVMRKYTQVVPAGSTLVTLTHNLNTQAVWGWVRDLSTNDIQLIGVTAISLTSASIEFDTAPTTNQWEASIIG